MALQRMEPSFKYTLRSSTVGLAGRDRFPTMVCNHCAACCLLDAAVSNHTLTTSNQKASSRLSRMLKLSTNLSSNVIRYNYVNIKLLTNSGMLFTCSPLNIRQYENLQTSCRLSLFIVCFTFLIASTRCPAMDG